MEDLAETVADLFAVAEHDAQRQFGKIDSNQRKEAARKAVDAGKAATFRVLSDLRRIADALERPKLPDGPIYWSEDEVRRLSAAMERRHPTGADMLKAVADEAATIMRDRAKQGA